MVDNTDGVYNGCILEFKLSINNLNKVLFQAVKYLSKMRVKGESIPTTICLIDLNSTTLYQYNSKDYMDSIQKIYTGAASKDNSGFNAGCPLAVYDYSEMLDSSKVKKLLTGKKRNPEEMYVPINLDENCIVGWAERYYRECPNASKGDFLGDELGVSVKITGEIREPKQFKGLINPFTEETNEKFKYLMDCLNDRLSKKDLGAFYTPIPYAKKSAELVEMAVKRALDAGKKDYIILDRCSGTGNLESVLIGLKDCNGDELISHCIVSTYEYYEYKVLNERIGDIVRDIIPPTEADVVYANGKISNADAMSEEFINNPIIKQYLDNEDCAIILYENPPYRDQSSGVSNGVAERSGKQQSYVLQEMKKEVKGVATNELANQFIWSGFRFYLRQPTDSYIVYSPIKYWKQYNFVNKTPIKAYTFNREYFHATPSSIVCVLWGNNISNTQELISEVVDIEDEKLKQIKKHSLKKVYNPASKRYVKISPDEHEQSEVWCSKDGFECVGKKVRAKSYYSDTIIGYIEADSFQISPLKRNITRCCLYDGNGCYLFYDSYKWLLPIWVAKHIPLDNWYEKDVYATTSDGGDKYTHDQEFLKSCLIYTCLSNQNKCLSFDGSDGRRYQNELCFDSKALALNDLNKMTQGLGEYKGNALSLDKDEKELMELWNKILEEAKKTKNYDSKYQYGVYQITKELNTFTKTGSGKNKKTVYDYPQLNGDLDTLRTKLKEYYKTHITDKMFEYELIK